LDFFEVPFSDLDDAPDLALLAAVFAELLTDLTAALASTDCLDLLGLDRELLLLGQELMTEDAENGVPVLWR